MASSFCFGKKIKEILAKLMNKAALCLLLKSSLHNIIFVVTKVPNASHSCL